MSKATHTLNPTIIRAPAALAHIAEVVRREAEARRGLELHCVTPGGTPHVVAPADRLAEAASILDDTAGDLRGTLALLDADDLADDPPSPCEFAGFVPAVAGAAAVATYAPTRAEVADLELVRRAHDLMRLAGDRLPASIRVRLVVWSGLVLDGTSRPVVPPAGVAALAEAGAAGPPVA
jgi:hypothetical protein